MKPTNRLSRFTSLVALPAAVAMLLIGCVAEPDQEETASHSGAIAPGDEDDGSVPTEPGDDVDNGEVPPAPTPCEELASDLELLLAEARSCSIIQSNCSVALETIGGCPVPANADNAATAIYAELFEKYADECPMWGPASCGPLDLALADCLQGPNVDGLMGTCGIVNDPTDPNNESE